MPVVYLGNENARDASTGTPIPGQQVTMLHVPDSDSATEAHNAVTSPERGAWAYHSTGKPAWVACDDDPDLAQRLAAHFGCPVGRPEGWGDTDTTADAEPKGD